MKRNKLLKMSLFGLLLISATSCGGTINKTYEFDVSNFAGNTPKIGEKVELTFDVSANFSYKIESVTINDKEIKNVFKEDDVIKVDVGILMNTETKDFSLSKVTYLNLENEKEYTYTTALETTVVADIEITYDGSIELTDWGLSQATYLLKDWEKQRDGFYLWFKIKENGDANVDTVDSFVVNGKTYSVLYDENENIYTLPDIKYEINPTTYGSIAINLKSINYIVGEETKTLEINDKKEITFTQGVINTVYSSLTDANKFDAYNKRIEQVEDVLTFGLQVYNPTNNVLSHGILRSSLGEQTIAKSDITLTNQNGNYFSYEIKLPIKNFVGEIGNTPKEFNITNLSLVYSDSGVENGQTAEVVFPFTYKCEVYTKFITTQNELQAIDGQSGSYILLNDISLYLNPFEHENSVIMNLNGYLNGNKKTIARTNDCFNSFVANINQNGKLADVVYKTAFRINNLTSNYTEGTAENKFTDGKYDENKNYAKSSSLCGINNGTIEKVKVTGSIYCIDGALEGKPLSYDGIVGLNYGTLKDVEIAFEHINTVNQSANYDFKEFSFITYKNYGKINGVIVTKSTGYMLFATNKAIVKNINFYFLTKENYGSIEKVLFLETFVQRIRNGHTSNIESSFSPYIDQFFYFPVKEGENASLKHYYYCDTLDKDREEYFGNIYNGRPVYKYWQENNTAEGQWYMYFEEKYGADVLESTPDFSDETLEDGAVRVKKFWTKYLINDYVYGATDKEGKPLFRQDITRLSAIEINTSLFETVFNKNQYKGTSSWRCDENDNTIMSTIHINL